MSAVGEEVGIRVDEVGTGVGYVTFLEGDSRILLLTRGKAGEGDSGSNAGSNDAADLLTPATGGMFVICFGDGAIECNQGSLAV